MTLDAPGKTGSRRNGRASWLAAVVLAASIGAVYGNALRAPFIFDDHVSIEGNPSITRLWPLVGTSGQPGPLNPSKNLPTSGRPLVNLSFAINYYFGGTNPVGYHAANIVIHFVCALLLYAIISRTLLLPYFAGRFNSSASWLALIVAVLWAVHPLVTEAVIYATQRTELMVATFYLGTLYCSLRYWTAIPLPFREGQGEGSVRSEPSVKDRRTNRPRAENKRRDVQFEANDRARRSRIIWLVLATIACWCGMASKEVMVSAPLMVLLFERTFVAGSLPNAIRRSWPLYIGLGSAWILLLILTLGAPHSVSAGFGLAPLGTWWLTQCRVLLMYLKLVVWPSPLMIHHLPPYLTTFADAWMYVLTITVLGLATLVLLWKNNPFGYLSTFVFAILAPTSVIPIPLEIAAERRMYLPAAALITLIVMAVHQVLRLLVRRLSDTRESSPDSGHSTVALAALMLLIAIALGISSRERLTVFQDEIKPWQQAVLLNPENYIAHNNLGVILIRRDNLQDAISHCRAAVDLKPDYYYAWNNLGIALTYAGRFTEAVDTFQNLLAKNPDFAEAHSNLGLAYRGLNRYPEAIESYQRALQIVPEYIDARIALAKALYANGDSASAIKEFRRVLESDPNNATARCNLGLLLYEAGDFKEAIPHLEAALPQMEKRVDVQNVLADCYRETGDIQKAIERYNAALRVRSDFVPAYQGLAKALALANRPDEAIATAKSGIDLCRSNQDTASVEQLTEWLEHFEKELRRSQAGSSR